MEFEYLSEKVEELKSLLRCYLKLEEWKNSTFVTQDLSAIEAGSLALGNAIREILAEDRIFPIIASDNPYPLEDFHWHVKSDTPTYITKIEQYLSNNN